MSDVVGKVIFNSTVTRLWWELDALQTYETVSNYHGERGALEVHRPVSGELLDGPMRSARMGAKLNDIGAVLFPIDMGTLDDGRFYILRAVPRSGGRLVDVVDGPMAVPRALQLATNLVTTIATIHARAYAVGKLRCETVFVEDRPTGEHAHLFDFRYAITEKVTDDHQQIDVRQCATILYELVSGLRITNAAIHELRRVPKPIQAVLEQALDGEFATAADFAAALADHPAARSPLPSARLIKRS